MAQTCFLRDGRGAARMEVPVCLEKRRVGILTVTPSGTDTVFRVRCTGLPAGLYRLYACGAGGELLLGVTEDGCLHRRFSAAMTTPLGAVTRCVGQPAVARPCRYAAAAGGRCDAAGDAVAAGHALPAGGAVLLCLRGAAGGETVCFFHFFRRLDARHAGETVKNPKKIPAPTTISCTFVIYFH